MVLTEKGLYRQGALGVAFFEGFLNFEMEKKNEKSAVNPVPGPGWIPSCR